MSAVTVGSVVFTVGIGSAAAGNGHDSDNWHDNNDSCDWNNCDSDNRYDTKDWNDNGKHDNKDWNDNNKHDNNDSNRHDNKNGNVKDWNFHNFGWNFFEYCFGGNDWRW